MTTRDDGRTTATTPSSSGRSSRVRSNSACILNTDFVQPEVRSWSGRSSTPTAATMTISPRIHNNNKNNSNTRSSNHQQQQQQQHCSDFTRSSSNTNKNSGVDDQMEMVNIAVEDEEEDDYEREGRIGQLPTIEEMKTRAQFEVSNLRSRQHQLRLPKKKKTILVVLGLGLLLLGCFIAMIVTVKKNKQYKAAVSSITTIVRVSHTTALDDPNSPQTQALKWMLYGDPLQLPLPIQRDDPFVQRYIIATFVFAVIPPSSSSEVRQEFGMLSTKHECLWNSEWKRADDDHSMDSIRMGILCNHDYYDHDKEGEQGIDSESDGESSNHSVKAIIIKSAGLHGTLPPELESLYRLEKLALDGNKIQGEIPVMPYLRYLSLAYNELTGYIPTHFSEMTRLTILSMSENALQGSIPRSFAAMEDLKILALDGNELTGGLGYIYPLTNLEEIYLSYNSLDDQLSNGSFGKMSRLKVIDMKSNRLSGPLPDILWNMTNLRVVDFHHNALDGHINDVVIPNHPLKYLDISSNILGGGFPPSFQNFGSLTHLDVSYNRFEELLPTYLANMTHMRTLMLTENGMFGPQRIPSWIRQMTDLQHLSFRLTSRTGSIPTWFGELTQLELLDLDWNHLDGTVPTEIGELTRLKYLMLNRNFLNGRIPSEVSKLPNLKILMVDNNRFKGDLIDACHVSVQLVADCGNPGLGCPDCDSITQLVSCPCCTSCCYDDADERCNMQDWSVDVEEEFRSGYDKFGYMFDNVKYVPSPT
jgi:Leucine-rich repeat (LRR) protein